MSKKSCTQLLHVQCSSMVQVPSKWWENPGLELQQLKHLMKSNVKSRQPGVLILMLPPPPLPPPVFNESLIISQLLYQISSLHKKNDRRPGEQQ